jgi:hypothetical protein
MARQQAARRPTDSRPGANKVAPQAASTLIRFEPELAVRAIAFHLIDEGISPCVDEASAQATVVRLQRSGLTLSVEKWLWSEMTNAQRLDWLLQKTQTASRLVSDELSVLEPARA